MTNSPFQYEEEKVWHDEECGEPLAEGCLIGVLMWVFTKLGIIPKNIDQY